jgi:hypothetical protein
MERSAKLRLVFGFFDLALALALLVLPALMSSWGGEALFLCWGSGLPVALVGVWVLVAPRTAVVPAILLGLIGLGIGGYMFATETLRRGWSKYDWVPLVLVLAPLLQLPIGIVVWRAVRATPTPAA